ncbi:MAG: hypothetical protein FWF06_07050 [Symbiobacteriaceae bacterium]|nr:hypothetical protein [Symbiobacteriaceae bacterium]
MSLPSNINIASNIYSRQTEDLAHDTLFWQNCRGGSALRALQQRYPAGTIRLTAAQSHEMEQDTGCSLAGDKQKTHGLVELAGELSWQCRCEYRQCPRFSQCMPMPLQRNLASLTAKREEAASEVGLAPPVPVRAKEEAVRPPRVTLNLESVSLVKRTFSKVATWGNTAIFTRTEGEAEWVSAELHRMGIAHILQRKAKEPPSLGRCLGDLFWDYRAENISKESFIKRYRVRVDSSPLKAEAAYAALARLINDGDAKPVGRAFSPAGVRAEVNPEEAGEKFSQEGEDTQFLSLPQLSQSLQGCLSLPRELHNTTSTNLYIATIHDTLDIEWQRIFLLGDELSAAHSADELQLWHKYAALAKEKLFFLRRANWHLLPLEGGRWLMSKRPQWKRTLHCDRLVVGLPGDIAESSYIGGEISDALARQRYIATQVTPGDEVTLRYHEGGYQIWHQGHNLGTLSAEAQENIRQAIARFFALESMPVALREVYVTGIISVNPGEPPQGCHPYFQESPFWLGLELAGFAQAVWSGEAPAANPLPAPYGR